MDPTIEQSASAARPRIVAKAIQFLASAVVIGLLNAIYTLVQRTSGIPMLVALIIVVAFFSLLFFLVMKISAGRNWARILWLILVLLNVPFAILAYPDAVRRNVISGTVSIIIVILQLIGTCLLFTKNSNLWFRNTQMTIAIGVMGSAGDAADASGKKRWQRKPTLWLQLLPRARVAAVDRGYHRDSLPRWQGCA